MEFVADLHLHSKYSRAVSQNMVLPIMARWAKKKGLGIISSSDWTHPLWLREIKAQLEEASQGLYKLKGPPGGEASQKDFPLFLLSTEIASIYTEAGKLRRIHNLLFSPNIETAEKINKKLLERGCNLLSDGRPIIGLSSKNLLELVLGIDERIMLIPCHVWTPHFGMYGSASGFDSLNQAFGDLDKYIYGIETGLSSDPAMNWQVEELDNRSILSFSDAHSPAKMGREATVFVENKKGISNLTYDSIASAIKREKDSKLKIGYTIEFYPEEGKYHFSGHGNCKVVRGPDDTKKDGNICPVCKRRLTEGVLYRVQQLAKRSISDVSQEKISSSGIKWHVNKSPNHPPYVKLVPFLEVVAEAMESTTASIKVKTKFDELCIQLGSEIEILLKTPIEKISQIGGAKIAEGVAKVRNGNIAIDPGYDGEYGKVKIWNFKKQEIKTEELQIDQMGLQF